MLTRELREEVVLVLLRSNVRILLLQSTCGTAVHSKVVVPCFAFSPDSYRGPYVVVRQACTCAQD